MNTPPAPEVTDCLPMMPIFTPDWLPRTVPVIVMVVLVIETVAECWTEPAVPVSVTVVVAGAEPPATVIVA